MPDGRARLAGLDVWGDLMDGTRTILIVGEDAGASKTAKTLGFRAIVASQLQDAIAKVRGTPLSLVLVNLPGNALEPRWLRQLSKEPCPILIVADPEGLMPPLRPRNGKIRTLHRPLREADLDAALRSVLDPNGSWKLPRTDRHLAEGAPLFDHSPAMRAIKQIIAQIADTNATVLIRGESGVGKDLVARAIHAASPRHDRPFVKINCAALPAELLEAELFGHEKGAFTGAYRRKLGKFEFANHGTLFLDEIGELPLGLQAKLLHVLQDQEFSRLGGGEMIRVDTRVIASTNRDLEAALAAGQFREDLYYRLNVVEIKVPPLRERKEEIPVFVAYFLEKFLRQYGRKATPKPEILQCFNEYSWPGNVRELENMVRRLVVLDNGGQIQDELLARQRTGTPDQPADTAPPGSVQPVRVEGAPMGLREIARRAAREAERRAIAEVLDRVRWNRTEAARLLKISYKTILSKIVQLGLAPKQRRNAS